MQPFVGNLLIEAMEEGDSAVIEIDDAELMDLALAYSGDPAMITWTKGTTGKRKGVIVPWPKVKGRCANLVAAMGMDNMRVTMPTSLFAHSHSIIAGQLAPMMAGLKAVPWADTDDPRGVADYIDDHGVTCWVSYFDATMALVRAGTMPKRGTLRCISLAGQTLTEGQRRTIAEAFEVSVINCYGASEVSLVAFSNGGGIADGKVGRLAHDVAVRIVDGQIEVKTPYVADGYLGSDTEFPLDGGWYKIGDRGRFDRGVLYVDGRNAQRNY